MHSRSNSHKILSLDKNIMWYRNMHKIIDLSWVKFFSFFTLSAAAAKLNFFTSTKISYTSHLHYFKTDFRFLQATKKTEKYNTYSLWVQLLLFVVCVGYKKIKEGRNHWMIFESQDLPSLLYEKGPFCIHKITILYILSITNSIQNDFVLCFKK